MNPLPEKSDQSPLVAPLSTPRRGEGTGVGFFLQLYRYHKGLFACIALFWLGQLVVFYKKGALVSPWYNYGMYSAKRYLRDTLEVNRQLTGPAWHYLLSPQQDDKVNLTLDTYRSSPANDSLYQQEISRLLPMLKLPKPSRSFYQHHFAPPQFHAWFTRYAAGFGNPLQPATVQPVAPQKVVWNGTRLAPVQSPQP